MTIKIIKKGKSKYHGGREYIVISQTGDTLLQDLVKRFGKEYYPGATGAEQQEDGTYTQILFKRDKPLKSTDEIKNYFNW